MIVFHSGAGQDKDAYTDIQFILGGVRVDTVVHSGSGGWCSWHLIQATFLSTSLCGFQPTSSGSANLVHSAAGPYQTLFSRTRHRYTWTWGRTPWGTWGWGFCVRLWAIQTATYKISSEYPTSLMFDGWGEPLKQTYKCLTSRWGLCPGCRCDSWQREALGFVGGGSACGGCDAHEEKTGVT